MAITDLEVGALHEAEIVERALQSAVRELPMLRELQNRSVLSEPKSNGTWIDPNATGDNAGGGGNGTTPPEDFVWVEYWLMGDTMGSKPLAR